MLIIRVVVSDNLASLTLPLLSPSPDPSSPRSLLLPPLTPLDCCFCSALFLSFGTPQTVNASNTPPPALDRAVFTFSIIACSPVQQRRPSATSSIQSCLHHLPAHHDICDAAPSLNATDRPGLQRRLARPPSSKHLAQSESVTVSRSFRPPTARYVGARRATRRSSTRAAGCAVELDGRRSSVRLAC